MRNARISAHVVFCGVLLSAWLGASPVAAQQTPPATPVEAYVGVHILDVTRIDEVASTYDMEGYVTLRWRDPRLAEASAEPRVYEDETAGRKLREIWWPNVFATNAVGTGSFQRLRVVVAPDGAVSYVASVSAQLKGAFDFRSFPFDRQVLTVPLQSYSWTSDQVVLRVDEAVTGIRADLDVAEWSVGAVRADVGEVTDPRDGRTYSQLLLEVDVSRKSGFYLWKVVLPLVLLVVLSWTVFWMSEESMARRNGVTLTTLLTVAAYQFIVSESLPRLSYLTHLDAFVLLTFTAIAATALVNWRVVPTEFGGPAAPLDRRCRWLFPLGYGAAFLLLMALRSAF